MPYVTQHRNKQIAIVALTPQPNARDVHDALQQAIANTPIVVVHFQRARDTRDQDVIDGDVVTALLAAQRELEKKGGGLIVAAPSRNIYDLLKTSRLHRAGVVIEDDINKATTAADGMGAQLTKGEKLARPLDARNESL
jgi:anti-anti-sigma regulatory factor